MFKDFIQGYPNFDFHMDIFSDFAFDGVVNEEETKFVEASMLKVQMHNWNDFVVYFSQLSNEFNLQLEDFTGATHGNQSKSHDILRHEEVKAINMQEVSFDKQGSISAIEL